MSKLRDTLDAARRGGLHVGENAELVGRAAVCLMHHTDPAEADKLAEALLDALEKSETQDERAKSLLARYRPVEDDEVEDDEVEDDEVEDDEVEDDEVEDDEVEDDEVE